MIFHSQHRPYTLLYQLSTSRAANGVQSVVDLTNCGK